MCMGQQFAHEKTFPTKQVKVKMMKTSPTTRSIRNAIISVAAVSVMALPLFASASVNNNTGGSVGVIFSEADLVSTTAHEDLYVRLQNASRKICGSTSLIVTGSVRRTTANTECYEGTLTAAVERLDNPEVTALHNQ